MCWYCRKGEDAIQEMETLSKNGRLLSVDPVRHGCVHSDGQPPSFELRTFRDGRLSCKYYSNPANSNCTIIKEFKEFCQHHHHNSEITIRKKLEDFDCYITHRVQTGLLPRNPSEAQLSLHQLFKEDALQYCDWCQERKAAGKTGVSVLYSHASSAIAFLQYQSMPKDERLWMGFGAMATHEAKERERVKGARARHQKQAH